MHPIIIFDTEYTAWEGSAQRQWSEPWEHREIIQIGAVKVNLDSTCNECETFDIIVRPLINPHLSDYIVQLTNITQQQIDQNGILFPKAYEKFLNFTGDGIHIVSNGKDYLVIEENCQIHSIPYSTSKARFYNVSPFLSHYTNTKDPMSSELHRILGFEQQGSAHDGLDDARNIAYAIYKIMHSNQFDIDDFLNHPLLNQWNHLD